MLLGLARGSGPRSLAGMPARRGRYRRPLLDLPRALTHEACSALGLDPVLDPSNADPRYTRARVRSALAVLEDALGPGLPVALARTAALLAEDVAALELAAADLLAAAAAQPGRGSGELSCKVLAAAPDAVRRRALLAAARAAGAAAGSLSRRHALALDALVTRPRGQGPVHLPGGVVAGRRSGSGCGTLWFAPGGPGALSKDHPASRRTVQPSDMGPDLEKVLLTEEEIDRRLDELAAAIDADYAGRDPLLVGVLKGAVMVMADLSRRLSLPVEQDWMAISSYGSGTKSSGVVRILKDLERDITGRDVLIVEDIVDSGLTLSWIMANLSSRGPASVEVCTLLRKPEVLKVDVPLRYVGFDIPNEFVVGYGLDYAERYRNLRVIGTLAPHVYGA